MKISDIFLQTDLSGKCNKTPYQTKNRKLKEIYLTDKTL